MAECLNLVLGLLRWWLQRLRHDAMLGVRDWAQQPEWPLLFVGVIFFQSFLLHWLGYRLAVHRVGWSVPFFEPTSWEGRTGWRKPMVFGISNAMIFVSLMHALRAQKLVQRRFFAHLAAWSTAIEVGIITLQAWRGVPSHFNMDTSLDATLYGIKLISVSVLSLACLAATAGVLLRLSDVQAEKGEALRHGFLLMCVAIVIGFVQVFYGHLPHQQVQNEASTCYYVTAGAHGSPCYEVHGKAIVKLAHFLPLHATEVLLLLAWAARHAFHCHKRRLRVVRTAAVGCWLLALLGLWTTSQGDDIKHPSPSVLLGTVSSLASIVIPFVFVLIAPYHSILTK